MKSSEDRKPKVHIQLPEKKYEDLDDIDDEGKWTINEDDVFFEKYKQETESSSDVESGIYVSAFELSGMDKKLFAYDLLNEKKMVKLLED